MFQKSRALQEFRNFYKTVIASSWRIAAARDVLLQQHDRRISAHMLRTVLIEMVDEGKVASDLHYKNRHSKVASRVFKPIAEEQQH